MFTFAMLIKVDKSAGILKASFWFGVIYYILMGRFTDSWELEVAETYRILYSYFISCEGMCIVYRIHIFCACIIFTQEGITSSFALKINVQVCYLHFWKYFIWIFLWYIPIQTLAFPIFYWCHSYANFAFTSWWTATVYGYVC